MFVKMITSISLLVVSLMASNDNCIYETGNCRTGAGTKVQVMTSPVTQDTMDPVLMKEKRISPRKLGAIIKRNKPAGKTIESVASCGSISNLLQFSKLDNFELSKMYLSTAHPLKYEDLKNDPTVMKDLEQFYYDEFLEFSYSECPDKTRDINKVFSIEELFILGEYDMNLERFSLISNSKYPLAMKLKKNQPIIGGLIQLKPLNEVNVYLPMTLKGARSLISKYGKNAPIVATYYFKIHNSDPDNLEQFIKALRSDKPIDLSMNETIVIMSILYKVANPKKDVDYSRHKLHHTEQKVIGWQYFE